MARIKISLNDDLLSAIDAEAKRAGTNRNALVEAALLDYLEVRQRARKEADSQRRMDEACMRMDALAEKLGDWDPVKIIRPFRGPHYRRVQRSGPRPGPRKRL